MPYYPGQHKVICERCGFTRLSNECAREPKTGFFVCKDTCLDQWHPQDKPIFGLGEMQSVQDHFPENITGEQPVYLNPGDNTVDELPGNPASIPAAEVLPDSRTVHWVVPGEIKPEDL